VINYVEFVRTAETQLKAEGHPLSGDIGDEATSDEQKGILTCRTAWLIYQTDQSVGLLQKTGGANYRGLSSDRVMDRYTGELVDICSTRDDPASGKFYVTPGWHPDDAPVDRNRWIEPTRELAELPPDDGTGDGDGGTGGDGEIVETAAILARDDENTQRSLDRDDENTQRVLDRLDQIVASFNEGLKKVIAVLVAQNRPDGEGPPSAALLLLLLKAVLGDELPPITPASK
jgi:hypothetical protein